MKGILEQIYESSKPYKNSDFTLDTFKKLIVDSLYNRSHQGITIYTGLRESWIFDYVLADQSGILSYHMKKHHARFTRLIGMGLYEAVDINGIVWMIGKIKGKGYYFSNTEQRTSSIRKKNIRFIVFEERVMTEQPYHYKNILDYSEDQLKYWEERNQARKNNTHRKGTWTPEQGAMYRGY